MISVSRNRQLYESWKPASFNPTVAGFIAINDAEFQACRPVRAYCINVPFSIFAQNTTKLAHISVRDENVNAPPRHYAIGALLGFLSKTHHSLATDFSDPNKVELGTQFRNLMCIERLHALSGEAIGVRVWRFCFDSGFRESLNLALQIQDVAEVRRARLSTVTPHVGTAAHKRFMAEKEAYKQ